MKNTTIWHLMACLLILVSCIKETDRSTVMSVDGGLSFEAFNADNLDTRTVRQNNGSVLWSPGDAIHVFYGSMSSKFTASNTTAVATATFNGSLDGIVYDDKNQFWALYPYSDKDAFDGQYLTFTLPNSQNAVAGTFDKNLFPAVARSKGLELSFRNVCGGIKFCLNKDGVSKVTFKGNHSETLAGTVKVGLDNNNIPFVSEVLQSKSEISISAPDGSTFQKGKWYHMVALPVNLRDGFTMTLVFKADKHREIIESRKSVQIKRSVFGTLTNVNDYVTDVFDPTGGSKKGSLYMGIIGFNIQLFNFAIRRLDADSKPDFYSFIEGLQADDISTLLYLSVDESLNKLQEAAYPSDLSTAALITFTDGLDMGTPSMVDNYPGHEAYLKYLHERIVNEPVSNQPLTAWSIGLPGVDVDDRDQFSKNLVSIATSESTQYWADDMPAVDAHFQQIARQLNQSSSIQSLTIEIPAVDQDRLMRFTLDGVEAATSSKKYIEGVFDLDSRSLKNVKYQGIVSTSGSTVQGVADDPLVTFTFSGLQSKDDALISEEKIDHWLYNKDNGKWVSNHNEFNASEQASVYNEKRSAIIMLNMDCSKSLGTDLDLLKGIAKHFIDELYKFTIEVNSVSLNNHSLVMEAGSSASIKATITPSNAFNKSVMWSSSDPSVATINGAGKIKARKQGTTTITVRTADGGKTDVCYVTVTPSMVDLGLSVKWANSNIGANDSNSYGNYYAWGEIAPKSSYSWSNYRFWKSGSPGSGITFSKYVLQDAYGKVDYRNTLDPADDVAMQVFAGQWRMPTREEMNELKENCTWQWTTMGGKKGYKITSNKTGYRDRWIFLPAAGGWYDGSLHEGGTTSYWSSSLDYGEYAVSLGFSPTSSATVSYVYRYEGFPIRPVYLDPQKVSWVSLDRTSVSLDLGKSTTLYATVNPSTATNKSVSWSSSNTSVVTVTSSGKITGKKTGTAKITVTTSDGSRTASCLVTVNSMDVGGSGNEGTGEDDLF